MWVRVHGAYDPELMVSSLETFKKAPNKPMIVASPPVIWFQSLSPWIGHFISLVAPPKPLNNPLVSNEATAVKIVVFL